MQLSDLEEHMREISWFQEILDTLAKGEYDEVSRNEDVLLPLKPPEDFWKHTYENVIKLWKEG